MEVTICFIRVSLLLAVQNLRLIAADCEDKCEQSAGSFSQTGLDNHAMLGHSFKNFTLAKTFDCHVKCFEEKCRCRAYQTRKNHCELLDECKRSAPADFVFQKGYTYYEMNREYVKQVRNVRCYFKRRNFLQTTYQIRFLSGKGVSF